MRIAIAGDYCEGYATHRAMLPALADAGAEGIWVPTGQAEQALEADGIWLAPGNPYASFDAVLGLVRFARERNVLGIADADTAEHTGGAGNRVLIPVVCPISNNPGSPKLFGGVLVHFLPESRLRRIMGVDEAPREYFCNFEENPLFREHF